MELNPRFDRLKVEIPLLPDLEMSPAPPELLSELISFYQQFSFYQTFGQAPFDYLSGLSLRYACWTLPKGVSTDCLEIHSLWLSLVWLIDGVFDKLKYTDSKSVVRIIQGKTLTDPDPFLELVQAGYSRYLRLNEIYRKRSPRAYDQLVHWTIKYLKNLGKGPVRDHLRSKSCDFQIWRLVDGAMMCVVWHLILFTGEEIDPTYLPFFEKVSLLVSYHNDILSFHRDIVQGTPNLVKTFSGSHWEAFDKSVKYVDNLYRELADDFNWIDPLHQERVGRIALAILEGSYNWSNTEARYKVGLKTLEALKHGNKEKFHQLLWTKDQTAGDPK